MTSELDQFIQQAQTQNNPDPETKQQALALELMQLANQFSIDETFKADLKSKFEDKTLNQEANSPIINLPNASSKYALRQVATVTIAIIGLLLFFQIPPVNAFAAQMVDLLFPQRDDNTRLIDENQGADAVVVQDLESVRNLVPFEVRTLETDDFRFLEYYAERNVALSMYFINNETYIVQQQPLADVENGLFSHTWEPYDFGQDAEIVMTSVTDYPAEYVQGLWVRSETTQDSTEEQPYVWSNSFGAHHLRWQDDMFIYEIFVVDYNATMETLTSLAIQLYE